LIPTGTPSFLLSTPRQAGAVYWLDDATGPVSGCVVELEQYPAHGRNPDKVGL
jgi:hypothetical protein